MAVTKFPKPAPVSKGLTGPMSMTDIDAALSDRYPHHDYGPVKITQMEVSVPEGFIVLDMGLVNKCKNTAELRAYIDALPII